MSMVVYDEMLEILTRGATPQEIVAFQLSDEVRQRVGDLLHQEKTEGLSDDEKDELDRYMEFDRIMILAKARAHLAVKTGC